MLWCCDVVMLKDRTARRQTVSLSGVGAELIFWSHGPAAESRWPRLAMSGAHRKMFLATARRETSGTNRPPHPPPTKPAWCIPPPWWGGTAFAVSKAKHEGKRLYTKSTKSLAAENSFVLKSRNEQSARRGTLSGLLPLSSISPKSIRPTRAGDRKPHVASFQ